MFLDQLKMSRARKTIDDELQKVEFETSEEVDVVPTFDSMGIREDLLRGIYAYGFEKPSAIQQRAIKQIIKLWVEIYLKDWPILTLEYD